MKVLVTGASGFLGARLVEELVKSGHQVRTFGRSPKQSPRLASLPVEHFVGDIEILETIGPSMAGVEVLFHLAGLVSYKQVDEKRLYAINVLGTQNVMQCALKAGVTKIIHMGSIAGMGIPEPGTIADESLNYNLLGNKLHYCDSKYYGEQEFFKFVKLGLPGLALNPGITFGEGDTHPHHHTIFRSMNQGWLIGYPVGGVMFTDLEDLTATCLNAIERGRIGERYVIGSANMTFRAAAETLASVLNGKAPTFPIPGPLSEAAGSLSENILPLLGIKPKLSWQVAWLSQREIFFSSEKAIAELGHNQTSFADTVKRTAPYYLGG